MASWSIMRSSCNFLSFHKKLLQVAIWLGPWTISLSRVLTTWQTSVCWSVIYLCEAVAEGVRSFGSTLCTQAWYQSFYEEPPSVLIKIWNRCCRNFKRVSGFLVSMHLWDMGDIPLHPECRFHCEIVFVSSETISVWSRNTHFGKSQVWNFFFVFCFSFFCDLQEKKASKENEREE